MCRRKIISRCQQIGRSCLKKLIVRTSCLGAGEGGCGGGGDSLWWTDRWGPTDSSPRAGTGLTSEAGLRPLLRTRYFGFPPKAFIQKRSQ